MFENPLVAIDDLPNVSPMRFTALSPHYCVANMALRCIACITAILLAFVVNLYIHDLIPVWFVYVLYLVIIFLGGNVVYGYFADKQKGYCLRTHDISFTSGLLFKRTVTQPLCKLQHSEIRRSLIARSLGLASIYVFSAGGGSQTFVIPGLVLNDAEKIRQLLIDYES